MKILLVLRHAKSSWATNQLADHDRPLKGRGKRDAPRMGRLISSQDLVPDLIISSSARRAISTAQLVSQACGYDSEIEVTREFYHADPEIYLEYIAYLPDDVNVVMVVGHNPGIEELVEEFSDTWQRMPTAALAEIRLDLGKWSELKGETKGELANLWIPREQD
jgi:phosphohistidine phosphatase